MAEKTGVFASRGRGHDEIPPRVFEIARLRSLDLSKNNLKRISPKIGNCTSLVTFIVDDNKLEVIPEEMGNLSTLQVVSAQKNRIHTLPSLAKCTKLKKLNMSHNQVDRIFPDAMLTKDILSSLSSLVFIDFSSNWIKYVFSFFLSFFLSFDVIPFYVLRCGHSSFMYTMKLYYYCHPLIENWLVV